MAPTLRHGERVVIDLGAYRKLSPRSGDIVLVRHPYRSDVSLVKRVIAVESEGRIRIAGDNPSESTDSRDFGPVPRSLVLGRVLLRPS
jgi:nickel-type superoxide dismutase maturation protease